MTPLSPRTEADLRDASEAMQKAAQAMIAATESFRRQFNAQQQDSSPQRPYTYHADEARCERRPQIIYPADGALPEGRHLGVSNSEASATNSISRASSSHPPKLPQVTAPTRLGGISPKRPETQRGQTTPPSFVTKAQTGDVMTPAAHGLISAGSTPTLAPVARTPAAKTGPGRQWLGGPYRSSSPSHVDLVEAAERIKVQMQQTSFSGTVPGPTADMDKPSPILHIGRHTYIRSTDDSRTTLLSGEEVGRAWRRG